MSRDLDEKIQATCHKFTVDFLSAEILVAIGSTVIDAVHILDPNHTSLIGLSEGQLNECAGLTIRGEDHYVLAICLQSDADINVVVHESVHGVNYLIHWFDLSLDTEEDELQAYLTAFFVDRVIDALEQHKEKNESILKEDKLKKKTSKKTKS